MAQIFSLVLSKVTNGNPLEEDATTRDALEDNAAGVAG